MEAYQHQISLAVALAIGLLVGLEREHSKPEPGHGSAIGGLRTYPMFALVGAVATLLSPVTILFPIVAFLGVAALLAISYTFDVRRSQDGENHGATTEASILAIYLLGALATSRVIEPMADRLILVAGLGVVIAFLLSSKPLLHGVAQKISRADYHAAVQFLIIAVVVLPLLPDRDLGPANALNPRALGLLVVVISALSFGGYLAMRIWGERGLLLGAAIGALVSSTAVTLSFARRVAADAKLARIGAGAIAVAWTVMTVRVAVVIAVMNPALLRVIAMPLAAASLVTLASAALAFRKGSEASEPTKLENPFELGGAIKVTLVFAVVLVITAVANQQLGASGVYLASALGGTTDVDASVISNTRLAGQGAITPVVAAAAILIAAGVNTVVKAGLATAIGGKALGARVIPVAVGVVVVGAGAFGIQLIAT